MTQTSKEAAPPKAKGKEEEGHNLPALSVIMPAYNEERGIVPVLEALDRELTGAGVDAEIIVVDDGSADATAEKAGSVSERITVIRHNENRGYGASLKTGFRKAKHALVAIIDADGTYHPKDLIRLLERAPGQDMVVGARTGQSVHIPLIRRPAKWLLRSLATYLTRRKIPDLNSGLRLMRTDLVHKYMGLFPNGFSLTTTITMALLVAGYQVEFIPIDYEKRTGSSKIRPLRDTIGFLSLILRTIIYFNPLRIFVPISILLIVSGGLVGVLSYLYLPRLLDTTTALLVLTGVQVGVLGLLADLVVRRET